MACDKIGDILLYGVSFRKKNDSHQWFRDTQWQSRCEDTLRQPNMVWKINHLQIILPGKYIIFVKCLYPY